MKDIAMATHRRAQWLVLGLLLCGAINIASAQVPKTISYQGRIQQGTSLVSGKHLLHIAFYDAETGGTKLYEESQQQEISDGLFSIVIGTVTPFPASLPFDKPYFLAISIDGADELLPRTPMTSVPYSLNSHYAELAKGLTPDANGVVTSINELSGAIRITGDSTTAITQTGNIISIHSFGSGSTATAGIQSITSPDKTIAITGTAGPSTTIGVADNAITTSKLANGAVTLSKINQSGAKIGQIIKWNGSSWVAADTTIPSASNLIPGTTPNSTLRWNGTQWVENTNLRSDATGNTSVNGSTTLGDGTGNDDLTIQPGSGVVKIAGFGKGVVKSTAVGVLSSTALDLANDVTGILSVSKGGTGVSTLPVGQLLVGNGVNPISTMSLNAGAGIAISSNGSALTITNIDTLQWKLLGNTTINPATQFLGTTDLNPIPFRTNNIEHMRLDASGKLGIGTTVPSQLLEVRNGNILISNSGTAGSLQIAAPGNSLSTAFTTSSQTADITYKLPPSIGTANQALAIASVSGTTATLGWVNAASATAWNLIGNSSTTAGTNFLGTTDDQPLYVQVKNGATVSNSLILNPNGSIQHSPTRNARGASAVDLQLNGAVGTHVASGQYSVLSGGRNNVAGGDGSVVAGGEGNSTVSNYSVVGGGASSVAGGSYSVVSGGNLNSASGALSSVIGGIANESFGARSSVLGGGYLKLGANSVGYNYESGTTITNISALSNLAYFGNVDMMIGNTDNTARELRFYEPNTSFTYTATNFSSFKAGTQASDIIYILPTSQPTANQVLSATSITGSGPYTIGLGWTNSANAAWNLTGNSGTTDGTNFLGTTDNVPFTIRANNIRAFRIEPFAGAVNIIAGINTNSVGSGFSGATISGGGSTFSPNTISNYFATISGGAQNTVTANGGVVAGGQVNAAGGSVGSTVSGGFYNTASGSLSSIAGGSSLKVGNLSFGFNGEQYSINPSTTITDISSHSNTAYFGNVDLWLGNVDNTARGLRFYEPNSSRTYTNTNFSSFKAGTQTDDIIYTLPTSQPTVNQILSVTSVSGSSPYEVALGWATSTGPAWNLTGNSGTTIGTNFLGTTDNQPFEILVKNGSSISNSLIFESNGSIHRDNQGNARGAYAIDLQSLPTGASALHVASGNQSAILGGVSNQASGAYSVSTAGYDNIASGDYSAIGGGDANSATGSHATISGGRYNVASGDGSFIGGGGYQGATKPNVAAGTASAIVGGWANYTAGFYSSVAGGESNGVTGTSSAIAGGGYLRLAGNGSFGFNNGSSASDSAYVSANATAYFGNVDLWLGNTNNTASQLRFYEAQNGGITMPGAATNYSAFKAGAQTADITYTLPTTQPSANQVLSATTVSGTGPYSVTLGWADAGTGSGFVNYGPTTAQATLTPRTTPLFNIAYISSAANANAAGATITSSAGTAGNFNATGLTVIATATGTGLARAIDATGRVNINAPSSYDIGGTRFLWTGANSSNQNTLVGNTGNTVNAANLNTFVGYNAGYSNDYGDGNTFLGAESGKNTNGASGSDNTFVGAESGYSNTDGTQNTFIGSYSGYFNTTGNYNIFIGENTGFSNVSGTSNTFVGMNAGWQNTANSNSLFGQGSGFNLKTGSNNTFIGVSSGYYDTSGGSNVMIGVSSGLYHKAGDNNTYIGRGSGSIDTAGINNTMIGYGASPTAGHFSNATAIGASAQVGASNSIILGSISPVTKVGIGTIAPQQQLNIENGNVLLSRTTGNSPDSIQFQGTGTGISSFAAGAQSTTTINYTLPTSQPSANQVLTASSVSGSGPYSVALSWANSTASVWSLSGNSGTSSSSNFIGTTDNQDLVIKTNNSEALRVKASGNIGLGTTTPSHKLHSVNSTTTDEVAAIYGTTTSSTSSQSIGMWADASNTATSNTGTIAMLATGNGNTTAGQTNIALQVNDGEFTIGRTTETPTTGTTVNAATGGTDYSAEGPSGMVELTLGNGNLATAAPTANTMQSFGAITINNRYCQAASIVLVNVSGMTEDGTAPDVRDAAFIVNVDNIAAGSFSVRIKMIPSATNATNYSSNDKIRIGYVIVNPSR